MSQPLACSSRVGSGSVAGGVAATAVIVPAVGDCLRALQLSSSPKICESVAGELPRSAVAEPAIKIRGDSSTMKSLPFFCKGEVVKGFGRGSKDLGIPTANFPEHVVDNIPSDLSTGIYYGWGCVGDGEVHKMVMSIGWNPFYGNTKKSVETHIIHQFKEDFYGEILSIVIVGYIRPERSFDSLNALIAEIHNDIEVAKKQLDLPELREIQDCYFNTSNKIMNGH
ncbi:riboflavin kinase [Bombina bombina]|uniref:riboflavin kinase n=1 Tax=Bombina bombina TaxID=8345 RepID=UPI00235A6F09|nr:riboflavin kinase [Bombina bombina]